MARQNAAAKQRTEQNPVTHLNGRIAKDDAQTGPSQKHSDDHAQRF